MDDGDEDEDGDGDPDAPPAPAAPLLLTSASSTSASHRWPQPPPTSADDQTFNFGGCYRASEFSIQKITQVHCTGGCSFPSQKDSFHCQRLPNSSLLYKMHKSCAAPWLLQTINQMGMPEHFHCFFFFPQTYYSKYDFMKAVHLQQSCTQIEKGTVDFLK